MNKSIEHKAISGIYGNGRGWVFSPIDFADLAGRATIGTTMRRLEQKKTIRRVIRGLYDYPRFSALLHQTLSPDIDKVAQALARKFRLANSAGRRDGPKIFWDYRPKFQRARSIYPTVQIGAIELITQPWFLNTRPLKRLDSNYRKVRSLFRR